MLIAVHRLVAPGGDKEGNGCGRGKREERRGERRGERRERRERNEVESLEERVEMLGAQKQRESGAGLWVSESRVARHSTAQISTDRQQHEQQEQQEHRSISQHSTRFRHWV